jgi:sulfhydrogenase subunit alpha
VVDDAQIHVHHLTRVEGHGDIHAEIRGGRVADVRFAVVEAPRFFEAFLRDHPYEEVVHMASRICGICAVSHKCAALKATEAAFGVHVNEQTAALRRLAFYGEVLGSHVLHIYFLSGPDFFETSSIFPLVETDPERVRRAMRLKKLGYDLSAVAAGRHTHPVAMTVGGFSFVHDERVLAGLRPRLLQGLDDLDATVELFGRYCVPEFERETEYVSLKHPERYAFYDGEVFSSEGETLAPEHYRRIIREHVVPYSTAKYARWHRPQYMVGALARVNNNFDQLHPRARQAAGKLGVAAPCHNPFKIPAAQIVECIHCLYESLDVVGLLEKRGVSAKDEQAEVHTRAGRGVGAVEAPRGLLFHDYEYDDQGRCKTANLVIPTAQNLANLEADMRSYAPQIVHTDEASLKDNLARLVRSYDPCISCSTH